MRYLLIIAIVSLTACGTNKYKGPEFYYTDTQGVKMSCREPKPYEGGNCQPRDEWKR